MPHVTHDLSTKSGQDQLGAERSNVLQLSNSTVELEARAKRAEVLLPKLDPNGRILTGSGASFASEFSDGIAEAKALFTQGKLDEAFKAAKILTEKKSDFGLAYFVMGTVDAQRGRFPEAETNLNKARKLGLSASDEAWCLHNLGIIAGKLGRPLEYISFRKMAYLKDTNEPTFKEFYQALPAEMK